ncbi:MAG: class I SAM-dependent methyltransferase [Henriciella sp.]|nr:class I SAM-dependent methyltransferase [Henriciella sp.]
MPAESNTKTNRPNPFAGDRWIGYAAGGAFQNIVLNGILPDNCAFVVDQYFEGDAFETIPVKRPEALESEDRETPIILFTMSSKLFSTLREMLIDRGFKKDKIHYYGDVFFPLMRERIGEFGLQMSADHYEFIKNTNALLGIDNHSSAMGSALLLSMQESTDSIGGAFVELGVFRGGNAFSVCLANTLLGEKRPYYLIDSFEGFPELSAHDPSASAGMFKDTSYDDIRTTFGHFPSATVMKGYVPEILTDLPEQRYAVVYYDCDLHDPARDSLEYFWPKLVVNGYVLIHDYLPKLNGFDGVRLAVDEFLKGRSDFVQMTVPETTHLILKKIS